MAAADAYVSSLRRHAPFRETRLNAIHDDQIRRRWHGVTGLAEMLLRDVSPLGGRKGFAPPCGPDPAKALGLKIRTLRVEGENAFLDFSPRKAACTG